MQKMNCHRNVQNFWDGVLYDYDRRIAKNEVANTIQHQETLTEHNLQKQKNAIGTPTHVFSVMCCQKP